MVSWLANRCLGKLLLRVYRWLLYARLVIHRIRDIVEYVLQSGHCRSSLSRLMKGRRLLLLDRGQVLLFVQDVSAKARDCGVIFAWTKQICRIAQIPKRCSLGRSPQPWPCCMRIGRQRRARFIALMYFLLCRNPIDCVFIVDLEASRWSLRLIGAKSQ